MAAVSSTASKPFWALPVSDKTFYGTASAGGMNWSGTVFSLFVSPQLSIIPYGGYVLVTWPGTVAGFALQSTTNPFSPDTWTSVSPGPVLIGGQNVVLAPVSGKQKFYRLSFR